MAAVLLFYFRFPVAEKNSGPFLLFVDFQQIRFPGTSGFLLVFRVGRSCPGGWKFIVAKSGNCARKCKTIDLNFLIKWNIYFKIMEFWVSIRIARDR